MRGRKGPRPGAAARAGDGLKLHRRPVRADGRDYNVITLRPGSRARFSTNRFHETWHILSDVHGARLLGRLLWGLSFQRLPGTAVVIDRPHLDPNPFDAEPADPIVLVPAHLTTLKRQGVRELLRRLAARAPSAGTVRWHTWGLDAELTRTRERVRECRELRRWPAWEPPAADHGAAVERIGGALVFRAPPARLREWAVDVAMLGDDARHGMDYVYLEASDSPLRWGDGEVQIFPDFRRRVAVAGIARREVLADLPEGSAPADVNARIWRHNTAVRARGLPRIVRG
ncbi:hypothetical protein AAH991_28950 [Microbispora sp. ZYX-F-249]|uniref:Phospholipid/glycerol acyltransferase domain-containing protein n=1 Tax=Microbispora maris TaxID=3144104 RepID=A0ABV0AVA3_9ACTN